MLAGLRSLLLGAKDSWLRRNHRFVVVVAWLVDGLLFLAWFRNNEAAWEYFLTLIEIVGVTILSREVWFAQHIEKIRDSISRRARAVAVPWKRFPAVPTKDTSGAIDYLLGPSPALITRKETLLCHETLLSGPQPGHIESIFSSADSPRTDDEQPFWNGCRPMFDPSSHLQRASDHLPGVTDNRYWPWFSCSELPHPKVLPRCYCGYWLRPSGSHSSRIRVIPRLPFGSHARYSVRQRVRSGELADHFSEKIDTLSPRAMGSHKPTVSTSTYWKVNHRFALRTRRFNSLPFNLAIHY